VAQQEARQESVRLADRGDRLEAQLDEQTVLEGAPQALHAALRLCRAGRQPADTGLFEGPSHLRERAFAGELLGERGRAVRLAHEDPVPIAGEGLRAAHSPRSSPASTVK
jgi:hypothetical protein